MNVVLSYISIHRVYLIYIALFFTSGTSFGVEVDMDRRFDFGTKTINSNTESDPEVSYRYSYRIDKSQLLYPMSKFWKGCDEFEKGIKCDEDFSYKYSGNELPDQKHLDANLVPVNIRSYDARPPEYYSLRDSLKIFPREIYESDDFIQVGVREEFEFKWKYSRLEYAFYVYEDLPDDRLFGFFSLTNVLLHEDKILSKDFRMILRTYVETNDNSSKCGFENEPASFEEEGWGICDGLPYLYVQFSLFDVLSTLMSASDLRKYEYVTNYSLDEANVDGLLKFDGVSSDFLKKSATVVLQFELQNSIVNTDNYEGFHFARLNNEIKEVTSSSEKPHEEKADDKSSGTGYFSSLLVLTLMTFFRFLNFVLLRKHIRLH